MNKVPPARAFGNGLRRAATWLAAFALVAGVMACSAAPSAPSVDPTITVSAPPAATLDCARIELVGPSGDRVDLTGTWHGSSTVFYLRQDGECVRWIGLSDWPDQPQGAFFSHVFTGTMGNDFVLRGAWSSILIPASGLGYAAPYGGSVAFELSFEHGADEETLVLTLVTGGFYALRIVQTGPLPASDAPLDF